MSDDDQKPRRRRIPKPLNASEGDDGLPIQLDPDKLAELHDAASAAPRSDDEEPPPRPTPTPPSAAPAAGICAADGCNRVPPEGERLCPRHSGKGDATADTPERFQGLAERIAKDPPKPNPEREAAYQSEQAAADDDALQGDDGRTEAPDHAIAGKEDVAAFREVAVALDDTGEPFGPTFKLHMGDDGLLHVGATIDFATAEPVEQGINPDTGEPFTSYAQDLDLAAMYEALGRIATPGGRAAALAELIKGGAEVALAELHALQKLAAAKPAAKAYARTAGDMVAVPFAGSEVTRRQWARDADLAAVEVDGEAVAARIGELPREIGKDGTGLWLYRDRSPLFSEGVARNEQLLLPNTARGYPQNPRDLPLTMVAPAALGDVDHRKSLHPDLRRLLNVTYAATGSVIWRDEEGGKLLATTKDGGRRDADASDATRWRNVNAVADSIRLYYRDKDGLDYIPVVRSEPLGDGTRIVSTPAWFNLRDGRFTLSAARHPARMTGAKHRTYADVVSAAEYWIARDFDTDSDQNTMLVPVRRAGPGRWSQRMSWSDVMIWLACQRWDRTDPKQEDAALRRYHRMIEGLKTAGYFRLGEAGPGDVMEFETSPKRGIKSGRSTPWLQFRATARFCEAARLAADQKWRSQPLLEWFLPPAAEMSTQDAKAAKELRKRRHALTPAVVSAALDAAGGNITKAEKALRVGGPRPGHYLGGWLRKIAR